MDASKRDFGWQIKDDSTEELVDLLNDLYDNPDKLTQASINAVLNSQVHSFSAYRDVYVKAYLGLVSTHTAVPRTSADRSGQGDKDQTAAA